MSTSMTFQNKVLVRPPEKGSFPLDHQGQCKQFMFDYMRCLRKHGQENSRCRQESKDYLECRMRHNLMAREDWKKLGYVSSEGTGDVPDLPVGGSEKGGSV